MNEYQPLPNLNFNQRTYQKNKEERQWKKFKLLESQQFSESVKILEINQKRNILCYLESNVLTFQKLNNQNKYFSYKREKNQILNFWFRNDGLLGFYTTNEGQLKVMNLKQKNILKEINICKEPIQGLACVQEIPRVALGSDRGDLFVYDYSIKTEEMQMKRLHEDFLRILEFQPQEFNVLATAGLSKTIKLIDINQQQIINQIETQTEIEDMKFINQFQLSVAEGKFVSLYDIRQTNSPIIRNQIANLSITKIWNLEDQIIVSSLDQNLRVLDKTELKQLTQIKYDSPIVNFDMGKKSTSLSISFINNKLNLYQRQQLDETDEVFQKTKEQVLIEELFTGLDVKNQRNSYQYFNWGEWEKENDNQILIGKPIGNQLSKKDMLIRWFQIAEALQLTLDQKDSKEIISVLEQIYVMDVFNSVINQLNDLYLQKLLIFLNKKIDSQNSHYIILEVMGDLLQNFQSKIMQNKENKVIIDNLFNKINVEQQCCLLSENIYEKIK